MQTASQRLRSNISLVRSRLSARIGAVWAHARLGELYPEFLFASYAVTAASAPAMRLAAERSAALVGKDPLAEWLRDYYLEHAEEEQGHEQWILNDLESLGIARERVMDRLPYTSVSALVGAQYYWMLHVHPVAYLGFIAVLEQPTSLDFLQEVAERTGIGLSSMTAHTRHATLDTGHVAEFDAALDRLPLTERQQELMTISAVATVAHLEDVFADVLEHFGRLDGVDRVDGVHGSDGFAGLDGAGLDGATGAGHFY
jgi:hypothetical protein